MSSNKKPEDEILTCPECGESNFFRVQHMEVSIILKKVDDEIESDIPTDRDLETYYYPDNGTWVCRTCNKDVNLETSEDGIEVLVIGELT